MRRQIFPSWISGESSTERLELQVSSICFHHIVMDETMNIVFASVIHHEILRWKTRERRRKPEKQTFY